MRNNWKHKYRDLLITFESQKKRMRELEDKIEVLKFENIALQDAKMNTMLQASEKPSKCILDDVSKCKCGENSTGYTEVKCCNICGLPIETETWHCNWHNEKPNS